MKIKIILLFYLYDMQFINAMEHSLKPLDPKIYKQINKALRDIEQEKRDREQKLRLSREKLEKNKKLLEEKLNHDAIS